MTSVVTRDLREGGKKRGKSSTRFPYVRRPRGSDFALSRSPSVSQGIGGLELPLGYLAYARVFPEFYRFSPFSPSVTPFDPRRVKRHTVPKSMEALGADGARCRLMMTFKCGAASFDCSRGAAGRDGFFPLLFFFSFPPFFSLYRFFTFSCVSLLTSFESREAFVAILIRN